ncbi:MAG: ArnT family glycosyltransferase [Candidatus Hodarchaeota archaeon]
MVVLFLYFLTHSIRLVEYPAFSTDEMFYVAKANCWEKNEIPCVYGWYEEVHPEFTNPSTYPWLLILLFGVFGTSPLVLRSFMLVIGIVNLLLVFLIGRELGANGNLWRGYAIGIIGGLILALDRDLVYYSRIGYLDNPMNLCLTAFLYFYLRYLRTNHQRFAWIAGLAAGLGLWFKLSAVFILIGLAVFALLTRQIDGALRVQAMMVFFVVLYVQWGLSVDPVAFTNGNLFQITKESDSDPGKFWQALIFHHSQGERIDEIRMLILFSILVPLFYLRDSQNVFYRGSFLVFNLVFGAVIFFSFFTRSLFDYYLAGFASFYSILFAISIILLFDSGKLLYQKLLRFSKPSPNYQNHFRQYVRLGIVVFLIFSLFLRYNQGVVLFKSRNPSSYLISENKEFLDIISFIQSNIPTNKTFVAPIEISPWLNASGYSVWSIWLNLSTPDWIVRRYIQNNHPDYLVLHKSFLYIPQGLDYFSTRVFANYKILEQGIIPKPV